MNATTLRILGLTTLAAGLFTTGCSNTASNNVTTDGIYADLSVTADGSGSTVASASLRVGGVTSNTFLDLDPSDSLVAYAGSQSSPMSRNELLGAIWYDATFALDSSNLPVKIAFLRTAQGAVSAPNSTATMPADLVVTGPVQDTSFSRSADAVTVTWSGSGQSDPLTWSITGDCVVGQFVNPISDSGTLTIPAGAIQPQQNQGANSCQATITLTRTRAGVLDPAYGEGGSMVAKQVRTVRILSAP
jgi:hypothetical protein